MDAFEAEEDKMVHLVDQHPGWLRHNVGSMEEDSTWADPCWGTWRRMEDTPDLLTSAVADTGCSPGTPLDLVEDDTKYEHPSYSHWSRGPSCLR